MTAKGWGPGVANDASGKPRQMAGRPYDRRKFQPPTSGIGNNDYAANFEDFLNAAPRDQPWSFWYGGLEPHRAYEYGSGMEKGGKKLSDVNRVPGFWPDNEVVRNDMLDYAFEVEHFRSASGTHARIARATRSVGKYDSDCYIGSRHAVPARQRSGLRSLESCAAGRYVDQGDQDQRAHGR